MYVTLANKILPGFTTVTTSPRYLSMLCDAIGEAEKRHPDSTQSPIRLRQQRLNLVKSYERAWALACVLASGYETLGQVATDGLRGVQSVRRRLSELSGREKTIRTGSFNLLANQVRYGGIGAYSAMLEDCHLASMRSLNLRPIGFSMADAFPKPGDSLPVYDEDKQLSIEGLTEWGQKCHLGDFGKKESKTLSIALRGGEECGWDDEIRWTMLRFIAAVATESDGEPELVGRLLKAIQENSLSNLKVPAGTTQQIHAALTVIEPFERFYQACQYLFDAIRAATTDEPEIALEKFAKEQAVNTAFSEAKKAASEVLIAIQSSNEIDSRSHEDIFSAFISAQMNNLLACVETCTSSHDMLVIVLNRHRDVQHGRLDNGERKAPWIHHDSSSNKIRLSAQRYQLPVSQRFSNWTDVPWHPYRTSGARRFIRQCDIH